MTVKEITFKLTFDSTTVPGNMTTFVRAALEETLDYIDVYEKYPFRGMKAVEDMPFYTKAGVLVSLGIEEKHT